MRTTIDLDPDVDARLRALARERGVPLRTVVNDALRAGTLVTDAHLATLAIEHGAELNSCDTDFSRFAGLRWTIRFVPPDAPTTEGVTYAYVRPLLMPVSCERCCRVSRCANRYRPTDRAAARARHRTR